MFVLSFALAGPLHDAAQKGDLTQVKQLITEGANVNAKDKNGITPLHSAAVGDHMAVAELLFWGHDQMVEFLKQHGATD
jgi:ankyrin repeat protein